MLEIEAAIEHVNAGLASHQRVARIEFQAEDLPKTSTLKVQRNKLRERYVSLSSVLAVPRGVGREIPASWLRWPARRRCQTRNARSLSRSRGPWRQCPKCTRPPPS